MSNMITEENRFPLYIVSKGRWESRHTVKALEWMGCKYKIIIEEQEYNEYNKYINKDNILILPKSYQKNYNTCDTIGSAMSKGSGAARNFAWEHSIKEGYDWHWVMDDNIDYFYRLNKNRYFRVKSPIFFRWMEDFVLRYTNVGMAGPQYRLFVPRKQGKASPFILNTRVYSCNLIRNDLPYRWCGRYNEDTILSLNMLKDNWCTIVFYPFLQDKLTTQLVKGGNTDELYKNGTLLKSKMLVRLFPDTCELVWRYNRPHHKCDYKQFKQKLIRKPLKEYNKYRTNKEVNLKRVG